MQLFAHYIFEERKDLLELSTL